MTVQLKNIGEDKWITKKFNNGDWDYWLIVKVIDLVDMLGNQVECQYQLDINAVSPTAAGKENVSEATSDYFAGTPDTMDFPHKDEYLCEALESYGVSACLESFGGDDLQELLKQAREQIAMITTMFGFYMDKRQNMIGNNGWDFISGNVGLKSAAN